IDHRFHLTRCSSFRDFHQLCFEDSCGFSLLYLRIVNNSSLHGTVATLVPNKEEVVTVFGNDIGAMEVRTKNKPKGATVRNQQGIVCYECGRAGHFKKDCRKLRNQHHGNQTRNKTGGNEVTVKAYAIGGGGTNPDSNVVKGYAARSAKNKRRMESNPRNNRG
nr:hypothetical protein [Tanacetum cinerariifolium]